MLPLTFQKRDKPLNILCLGAHCDDIDIGCGGTVLRLLEQAPETVVQWVVFSSTETRAAEFLGSARHFLGEENARRTCVHQFRDGYLPHVWNQVKDRFEELKKETAPDVVFTHYRNDLHQDHRIVSELTWNTFRNHLILEYEIPKYDGDFSSPIFFSHLAEATCRKKIDLILESYPTQRNKDWFSKDMFMGLLRLRGMESNSPTRFAEGFYVRKMVF